MAESVTLVEQAYAVIRQDILSGKLEPGSPLRIDQLRNEYAIGASPLREALSRLLTDGLVTAEGLRGFRVAAASLEDFRDLTNVRKIIECSALELSIRSGDQEWEGRLVLAHFHLAKSGLQDEPPRKSAEEMERRNWNFHKVLIEGANSLHLMRISKQTYDLSRRYRQISLRGNPKRMTNVNDEHNAIFQATLKRDAKRAVRLLSDHIEATYESVAEAFGRGMKSRGAAAAKRAQVKRKKA